MSLQSKIYHRSIVAVLIFGSAFLIVALATFKREDKGLLSLLRGEFDEEQTSEKTPFTVKKVAELSDRDVPTLSQIDREIAKINEVVSPSIVSINTGDVLGANQIAEGQGSGVIVSEEGHVMTNYHVIDSKELITVELADGTVKKAEVIGSDPRIDLSMLRILGGGKFKPLAFGDSDKVKIGHKVFAFGNPFRLGVSFSEGNVSGTNRSISDMQNDLFQVTAALNRGQSGGALVNVRGELVGINSAIYAQDKQGFQGIAFSIPSNNVRSAMLRILKKEKPLDGYLGIRLHDFSQWKRNQLSYQKKHGALVLDVAPMSPAEKAGLKPDDVITHVNGKMVKSNREMIQLVHNHPNQMVKLKLWRAAAAVDLDVKFGSLAKPNEADPRAMANLVLRIGAVTQELDIEEKARGLYGVKVYSLVKGSMLDGSIQAGDYILSINGSRFKTNQEFVNKLRDSVRSQATTHLRVFRPPNQVFYVRLPKMSVEGK